MRGHARQPERRGQRRVDEALARRVLDAEGGLRTDHPGVYEDPVGRGVSFSQSYGASGDQARAVIAGLPIAIAALSLEPDISKLVKEKLVAADWNATSTKGIVSLSIVVIGVRPGNPKNIKGWADLVKPGVDVLTPNPFTSVVRAGTSWPMGLSR
jgi:ABC-type sulfate transport system substrate-binding protein